MIRIFQELQTVVGLQKQKIQTKTIGVNKINKMNSIPHNYKWFTNFNGPLYKKYLDYKRLYD